MPKRSPYRWTFPAVAALILWSLTGHMPTASADAVDCSTVKCVALTFDDGPGPYTDRLLQILKDNDAKATFFLVGNKVAANPAGAKRIADAGMEVANHTWDHPQMTTAFPWDLPSQLRRTNDAISAATGQNPTLWRPAGGVTDDRVNQVAAQHGLAAILWDVVPFDWINDANTAATRAVLMSQIRPGSVVLLHDTYSSTVDLMQEFLPVLKANGYHMVTVSHLLGPRAPGSVYGGRENGPPANDMHDIPPAETPTPLDDTPVRDVPVTAAGP